MLNGSLHTPTDGHPMPDGDGNAVQLALLDQQVRQTRADVAQLRKDVGELTRLAQQARGAGVVLSLVFAIIVAGPRVLEWFRPAAQTAAVPAPVPAATAVAR